MRETKLEAKPFTELPAMDKFNPLNNFIRSLQA